MKSRGGRRTRETLTRIGYMFLMEVVKSMMRVVFLCIVEGISAVIGMAVVKSLRKERRCMRGNSTMIVVMAMERSFVENTNSRERGRMERKVAFFG